MKFISFKSNIAVAALSLAFVLPSAAQAAYVTATGQGGDERSALHDAMRAAVEQEVGVYLDSRTKVQNYRILQDTIYAQSEGYISSYDVLSHETIGDVHRITIRADVDSSRISARTATLQQRKAIIGANLEDPRIAVVAVSNDGTTYPALENALASALQAQGFSRIIDLDAADDGTRRAFLALASDATGRKAQLDALLASSPCDYLAIVNVAKDTESLDAVLPGLHKTYVTCAARLVSTATGEITWSGTANGASSHWYAGAEQEALANAAKALAPRLARGAFRKAANVQQHIRVTVPQSRFGSAPEARSMLEALPGVQHAFLRSLTSGIYTIDLDYDGTAADLVGVLESAGYHVAHFEAERIIVE
ncbi:MAG: hypothetical protein SPL39_05400 [Selenomonadaceae bacterium]|nr:hypothetical protein [Selenomonadaceae bacterium]